MSGVRFGQLNPYDLHKHLINEYVLKRSGDTAFLLHGGRDASKDRTDADVLRDNHRFLWDNKDDDGVPATWEQQLARKYYDKLFKEYCVCDLSRYKENKVALRWRTEREVIDGRGQFSCANKACTLSRDETTTTLRSWEVNFAYVEQEQRKNALVKVRLCAECSSKLNYRSKKREVKKLKKMARREIRQMAPSKRAASTSGRAHTPAGSERLDDSGSDDGHNIDDGASVRDTPGRNSATTARDDRAAVSDDQCWTKPTTAEEKSREEEFDAYLEDLLL